MAARLHRGGRIARSTLCHGARAGRRGGHQGGAVAGSR
jgi:hypothetical protein